jgi:hypothetical protein
MSLDGSSKQVVLYIEGKKDGKYTCLLKIRFPETSFSWLNHKKGTDPTPKRPLLKAGNYRLLYKPNGMITLLPYNPQHGDTVINYCLYTLAGSILPIKGAINDNIIMKVPLSGYEGSKEFVYTLLIVDLRITDSNNNRIYIVPDDKLGRFVIEADGAMKKDKPEK